MPDDMINPSHYKSRDGLEAIDVIESFDLNFNLGNVVKYILRAGKKTLDRDVRLARLEDLKKARWYLEREIFKLDEVLTFPHLSETT